MANLPWSGRLRGRIADRCLYCGGDGRAWRLSSFADRCLECRPDAKPRPDLVAEYEAKVERLARAYCAERGLDYDAIMEEARRYGR
jgi:hypothetical protein